MIGRIRTKWFRMTFVLRHRWERNKGMDNYTVWKLRKEYELGIWVKPYLAVGKPTGSLAVRKVFSKDNHVRGYMIGLDLIVCKTWIDISGGRVLEIPVD
jgi:hypothetical protein